MPVIRMKPGQWGRAFNTVIGLWFNPAKPVLPRVTYNDMSAHALIALRQKYGADKIKLGEAELNLVYRATPNGVRLPTTLQVMAQGMMAGAVLLNTLRLAVHAEDKASVENAIKICSYHFAQAKMPHSRASIMAAWGKYRSVSHFFAVFLIDPTLGKQINRLLGLGINKREMAHATDTLPVNAKNVGAMLKDPEKFVANIQKLSHEILPKYFAMAERLRELGEKHYAPGQKVRGHALLDEKTAWNFPRGLKFPSVKVQFKRLTKAERTALSARRSLNRV